MIWLTWRQFRLPAMLTAAALAALAVLLLITGLSLNHLYYTSGIPSCRSRGDCGAVTSAFLDHHQVLQQLRHVVVLLPALVGIFWGAPLVAREMEAGTHRMVWTQSITRTRWLATKLAVLGGASILATELFSLMETWWFRPIDRIKQDRFTSGFSEAGLVPIGYAAFAFALGVLGGLLFRRTLPAMVVTLVGFTAARLAVTFGLRPHFLAPAHLAVPLDPASTGFGRKDGSGSFNLWPEPPDIPNAWIYSQQVVDSSGHALTSPQLMNACPQLTSIRPPAAQGGRSVQGPAPADLRATLQDCVSQVSSTYHQVVTYQPADRYWPFQWIETGIFLAAAFALAGLCVWLIRGRVS